jgi:BirA family biotin operon repressor/biotin-[acetyl-CoA-carboxylase] ligase
MPEDGWSLDQEVLTAASPWGVPVRVVAETGSTNDDLLALGEAGAPEGTLLFALHQMSGRGQFQRPWSSARGLGLWFSLLLRVPINDGMIPCLSAFPAVALVRTLEALGIPGPTIKAPNDLLCGGRKVAGILVETRTGKDSFAVIGIGLNVNHTPEDFPEELRDRAASLAMMAGSPWNPMTVASALLPELGSAADLMRRSPEKLLAAWSRRLIPAQAGSSEG